MSEPNKCEHNGKAAGDGGGRPFEQGAVRQAMRDLQYDEDTKKEVEGMVGSSRSIYHRVKFEKEFDHEALLRTLPEEHRKIYRDNPHMRQVFANG